MSLTFLALGKPRPHMRPETLAPLMIAEIEAVWRADTSGLIRDVSERADHSGVVMVCEADDRSEGEEMLATLPLARAGCLETEIIPLKPFALWATLCATPIDDVHSAENDR